MLHCTSAQNCVSVCAEGSSNAPRMPCLQQGKHLIAAGYALYSSATMLVLSWGNGVHGFTLDRGSGEFVLTHPAMRIPARGELQSTESLRQLFSVRSSLRGWPLPRPICEGMREAGDALGETGSWGSEVCCSAEHASAQVLPRYRQDS